ncbi:MAG: hypothetical protein WD557_13345 [Dehalococcoidia bacterium]
MALRKLSVLIASGAFAVAAIGPVGAEGNGLSGDHTPSASCWGIVSGQRASTEHDIGEHARASEREQPRMGLGNTAALFGLSVPELGTFLASVDGIDATSCTGT